MTAEPAPGASPSPQRLRNALVNRQLPHYPRTGSRIWLLALVTVATIVLYYLYFVPGSVLPTLLPYYHMSFLYFMTLIVIANAVGAFTAFIGGLSDRIGRANLTVYGLLVVGILQTFAIPNAHSLGSFDVAYVAIGFVEGIILVVTPALVRDFSPQMGRATAMGFWTLGPVLGSLVVSQVATDTLSHLKAWQDQFMISGFVCLAMFVIAFFALRELTPGMRDQLMVTSRERALIEARAKGINVDEAVSHPLRMFKLDLIASAFGISAQLLLYYAVVTIINLYWVIVFSLTLANANGLNRWYFLPDAIGLVLFGFLSDRLRVRKPFMVINTAAYLGFVLWFATLAHHPHTSYYTLAILMACLGFSGSGAYSAWMAHYTESVEAKNPALAATGLAVWGWMLRIIVAASFLVIPHVVSSTNALVNNQDAATALQAFQAAAPYAPSKQDIAKLTCPSTPAPASIVHNLQATHRPGATALASILNGCNTTHNLITAVESAGGPTAPQVVALQSYTDLALAIQSGQPVSNQTIDAKVGAHSADLAGLLKAEKLIVPAQKSAPTQWQHWWMVCTIGQIVFILVALSLKGRWSPRAAKKDFEAYENQIAEEMTKLGLG